MPHSSKMYRESTVQINDNWKKSRGIPCSGAAHFRNLSYSAIERRYLPSRERTSKLEAHNQKPAIQY